MGDKAITLCCRPGDSQALKVLAAAQLAVTKPVVQLKPLASAQQQQDSALGNAKLVLVLDDRSIADANAAAEALSGAKLDAASAKWLEWEASQLRPAVLLAGQAEHVQQQLAPALQHLAEALQAGGGSLSPPAGQLGLVDLALAATLLPLAKGAAPGVQLGTQQPAVDAWLQKCQQHPAFVVALKQVAKEGDAQLLATWAADAQAAACSGRVKLPLPGKRNVLITSALPYVNNVPHLGNIIGCVLSADVYARYCRARGYNTVFVCGTDEYGTATETKALEEKMSCADLCDKYHAIHASVYEWFDIQFDKFGRTPTRAQTQICQAIFQSLQQQGCLQEQEMQQLYSEALGKFLADRFVTGTCPKCKYEDARGDQCDSCGNLLNPTELINPKCKITGTTPVIRSTRHLFLDLPALAPKLRTYQEAAKEQGGWSSNCVQLTEAWMRDGLRPRCITRDLKWGVPVPADGFREKVFYVWFDAPIGYISITANYTPEWEQWWRNPENVELVQFMGKDNVPFHTVVFPASLLGSGEKWTMMRSISVTEYLNYEGGKFSKSRGTGVFGTDAKDTGIPVEVWRYYLLSVRPEQQDTDFKWSDLQARNNSELLANIGNFINRGLQFVVKFFEGKVPAPHPTKGAEAVAELGAAIQPKVQEYISVMEKQKLKDGIRLAMLISADGNKFIQDTKPWVVVKEDPEHCGTIVAAAVGVVRLLAALVAPYMPSFSRKVLAQLALPESVLDLPDELVAACAKPTSLAPPAGHVIGTPAPLVTAIADDTIATLRARFGGSQAEREAKAAATTAAPGGKPAAAAGGKGGGKDKAAGANNKDSAGPKENKPPKEKKEQAPKEKKEQAPKEKKEQAPKEKKDKPQAAPAQEPAPQPAA